jgi:hypothetical protein
MAAQKLVLEEHRAMFSTQRQIVIAIAILLFLTAAAVVASVTLPYWPLLRFALTPLAGRGRTLATIARIAVSALGHRDPPYELQLKISGLQREGKDITEARKLLGQYHATQLKLSAEQDRIRKALTKFLEDESR